MDERCVCQEIQGYFLDRAFDRLKLKDPGGDLLASCYEWVQKPPGAGDRYAHRRLRAGHLTGRSRHSVAWFLSGWQ